MHEGRINLKINDKKKLNLCHLSLFFIFVLKILKTERPSLLAFCKHLSFMCYSTMDILLYFSF